MTRTRVLTIVAVLASPSISTAQPLGAFRWHQAEMSAVAFSPDGRWLATCGHEDRVKLWPVEGLLRPWAGRTGRPRRKRS